MDNLSNIKGDSLEDNIKSIDGLITALNRKPMKAFVKAVASSPVTLELFQKDVVYPALISSLSGSIDNLIIYVDATSSKSLVLTMNILSGNEGRIVKTNLKKGFSNGNGSFSISGNTLISFSYTLDEGETTTPPIIGFTFKENINADTINTGADSSSLGTIPTIAS